MLLQVISDAAGDTDDVAGASSGVDGKTIADTCRFRDRLPQGIDLDFSLGRDGGTGFDKQHASEAIIVWAAANRLSFARAELTPFAQAMPEQYRGDCAVAAYRRYYVAEKLGLRGKSTWRRRDVPAWVSEVAE